jgi:hypothetical protein
MSRERARTLALMLIQDLNVRIINAMVGEFIRELVLNMDEVGDLPDRRGFCLDEVFTIKSDQSDS